MTTQPLIINGWETGVADSPHQGIGKLALADIESFPGAVKSTKKARSLFEYKTDTSRTFTADAGTDVCTASGTLNSLGNNFLYSPVTFTTTGTLPAGLATGTVYFLIYVSATTFKVATTWANADAGTAIDITDAGSGTHTIVPLPIGTMNHELRDPRGGTYFFLDSNGRVWWATGTSLYLLAGNTLTNASGNGLALSSFSSTTATYLFVFRNATVDVVNVFGNTQLGNPSWTSGWLALNTAAGTSNTHFAIFAQDNIIYFCDGRYVGSIRENSGSTFDPASGATYTATNNALDLPPHEYAYTLEELGANLLIGGNSFDKIYPWDRTSDSYNLPLIVPERKIYGLKNLGNVVYILAGYKGNIYSTQGTYVKHFKKVPEYMTNNAAALQTNVLTWGGITTRAGALLFGVGAQTSGNSGIYLLYPDGRLLLDNYPSTGSANSNCMWAESEYYYFGYAGGADYLDQALYQNFEVVAHSPLYRVGTKIEPATYSTLEIVLARPASIGGNVRIGYRQDLITAFTTIDTFVMDGSAYAFKNGEIGLTDIENIQVQAELDDGNGNVDIELLEVRLLP